MTLTSFPVGVLLFLCSVTPHFLAGSEATLLNVSEVTLEVFFATRHFTEEKRCLRNMEKVEGYPKVVLYRTNII